MLKVLSITKSFLKLPVPSYSSHQKKTETSNAEAVTEYTSKSKKQSTITDFGVKTHTQNAEIFWALDVVLSDYSVNSCQIKMIYFATCFLTVISIEKLCMR